jgi:hypothetical protein
MSDLDDQQQLFGKILQGDVEAYRKLETWGASLFLGAIALLTKQLLEWDRSADPAKRIVLDPRFAIVPAIVGLVAFFFLRMVNFRGRMLVQKLYVLAGQMPTSGNGRPSFGWLGLLLAAMPLGLGFAASWSLCIGYPERHALVISVSWVGGMLIVLTLVVHFYRCLKMTQ